MSLPIPKNLSHLGKPTGKAKTAQALRSQDGLAEKNISAPVLAGNADNCTRCGGFMVSHWCMNVNYDAGGMEILTKRCLQCGEVIDPVILENRLNPNREELKKKTRPLLSRPLASSKGKSARMSYSPLV